MLNDEVERGSLPWFLILILLIIILCGGLKISYNVSINEPKEFTVRVKDGNVDVYTNKKWHTAQPGNTDKLKDDIEVFTVIQVKPGEEAVAVVKFRDGQVAVWTQQYLARKLLGD